MIKSLKSITFMVMCLAPIWLCLMLMFIGYNDLLNLMLIPLAMALILAVRGLYEDNK